MKFISKYVLILLILKEFLCCHGYDVVEDFFRMKTTNRESQKPTLSTNFKTLNRSFHYRDNTQAKGARRARNPENMFTSATVDIMIVVDKYMTAFHGNSSTLDYVLSMMNMVSNVFKDPSLGAIINIAITRVIFQNTDMNKLNITKNADETLYNFCEWQFLESLSETSTEFRKTYDFALLLTRKNLCTPIRRSCGTVGLAYIGGTCTTNRKCAVVEDTGLNTAYTIAHEIGHSLGMTHDGVDNDCKLLSRNGYPHIMAAHWPTGNYAPFQWSHCSKKKLKDFLGSYKSYCIREKKNVNLNPLYQLLNEFPGKIYDADTQCKHQYGSTAKHCKTFKLSRLPTKMCKQLWCEIETENECVTKSGPVVIGTKCDEGKWCIYGSCVNNTRIPIKIHGGWSAWSNWTRCSRSCGIGIFYTKRLCNNPLPQNGGQYCIGEDRKYQTCNIEDCPLPYTDIRLLQCTQYNDRIQQYIPAYNELKPCTLMCRPKNTSANYSIQFQNKVIDGTRCRQHSLDVCIDGHCKRLGCDLKIDSSKEFDVCGICGGHGNTCKLLEGEFTQSQGKGYVKMVEVPQGSRNVLVQEVKPCSSFLAIASGTGTYYVNGNWTVELPGKFDINGTIVDYRRRGTQEFFFIEGPVTIVLHFMILFHDFNLGVKWRYVLPLGQNQSVIENNDMAVKKTKTKEYEGYFGWIQGSWNECSALCGGGITTRSKAKCLHMYESNNTIVNDELCYGAKLPKQEQKICNEHLCPRHWFAAPWTTCSTTCGLGRKQRSVFCKGQTPSGKWDDLSITDCRLEDKPITSEICITRACYISWKTSSWSYCQASCGQMGLKYRIVSCPTPGSCLHLSKPPSIRKCKSSKCQYQFIPKPWGECSRTCGDGEQTRTVECREVSTLHVTQGKCSWSNVPRTIRTCKVKDCDNLNNVYHHAVSERITEM